MDDTARNRGRALSRELIHEKGRKSRKPWRAPPGLERAHRLLVTGSLVPQIYNVERLNFFAEAIHNGKREALRNMHARELRARSLAHFDTGAISLAMIEGHGAGRRHEAALAHRFVLAQNNARMGFPEMAFNLFPGMGVFAGGAPFGHEAG